MTATPTAPVQAMRECLDGVRGMLPGLDDNQLTELVRDIERITRRAHSVVLELVAEMESRGIAAQQGFGNTARLLSGMLHLSAAEARTRVAQADLLAARRSMTGDVLAPRLPETAAALAAGEIGTGQVRVITETLGSLPARIPEPARERVEADLAGYARDFNPRRLRAIAQRVVATLGPDGPALEDTVPSAPARGELWLRQRRDGRLALEGWLDVEHGTLLAGMIEPLARPRPEGPDGGRDFQGLPARQADALIELIAQARAADTVPTAAGEPPHLTVTMDLEALRTGLGSATLDHGQPISAGEARRLACDCLVIPVMLGRDSEPLDVGRAMRTAPKAIRRALVARDGGCAFPGCDRPPQICAVHHARHWANGGETSVRNCCLLCSAHHQQVHLQGWDVTIHGGRVEFHPPPIIDPVRKPLTNPLRR